MQKINTTKKQAELNITNCVFFFFPLSLNFLLTRDGLDSNTQETSHIAFLCHYGNTVNEWYRVQQVAQVHKSSE